MATFKLGSDYSVFVVLLATDHVTELTSVSAANINVRLAQPDGTSVSVTPSAVTEVDAAYMPGLYKIDLPACTMTGQHVLYAWSTLPASDRTKIPFEIAVETPDALAQHVLQVRRLQEGRWQIDAGTATLTAFGPDNATPLQVWNLRDSTGNPASANPYERIPQNAIP